MFKEGLGQVYYQMLGIRERPQNPNPAVIPVAGTSIELPPSVANAVALTLMIATAKFHVRKHKSIIEGVENLPKQGPVIFASNHQGEQDTYKIGYAVASSGRVLQAVVKKGLVVKGFTESDKYLAEIGALRDNFKYKPLNAWVMKRIGVIPLDRENPDYKEFTEGSDKILTACQQELMFLQPHRYGDCVLRNLQVGAAVLARRYPNIPVVLMASSGSPVGPDKLTILPGVTYNEIKASLNRRTINPIELTLIFGDRIAPELPKTAYEDWLQTTREAEFRRLTSLLTTRRHHPAVANP